jgi:chromosome segregation ATPase
MQKKQSSSMNNFSRTKKNKSTLTLCAITAIFFACTGCEGNQSPPPKKQPPISTLPLSNNTPMPTTTKEHLPLINDDPEEIGIADVNTITSNPEEMSVIQFLNMQKQTQTKRIEVLKNELDETRARLDHIKNDIMIKGSTKEKQFNEKMQQLEQQVKDSSARILVLENALSERNNALEEKRVELENLSKTFSKTNNNLGQELEHAKASLAQELEQAKSTLAEERAQYERERTQAAEIENQLKETNTIINQLQEDLNSTHSRLEKESTKARELEAALEKTQQQYHLVMGEHSILQTRHQEELGKSRELLATLENTQHQYRVLSEQHPETEAHLQRSLNTISHLEKDLENTHARLAQEINKSEELEAVAERTQQQYQMMTRDYSNLQARLEESTKKTIDLTNSQQMFTKSKDILESGLLSIIKDLESQLAENMRKTAELTNTQQQVTYDKSALEGQLLTTIDTLKGRLADEQQRAQDYQQQLAVAIENSRIEQQRANDLKQMVARQSQNNKELAMNLNEKQSTRNPQEIADLQKRLGDAEAYARELEASLEQVSENGVSAMQIHQLDKEIETHKESLIAAQLELLELSEDYAHLDEKYGTAQSEMAKQITKLEAENIALAKNLENAQQRLATAKQETSASKDEQYKRLNATLDHVTASLEREKTKRQALENEIADLLKKQEAASKALPNIALAETIEEELQVHLQDALAKYEEAQQENKRLQQKLESTALWASNLQNEVAAYETSTGNTAAHYHKVNGTGDNTPAKLKAKIAYLTTRLAQEKDRAQEALDKLQEAQAHLRDLQNYGN